MKRKFIKYPVMASVQLHEGDGAKLAAQVETLLKSAGIEVEDVVYDDEDADRFREISVTVELGPINSWSQVDNILASIESQLDPKPSLAEVSDTATVPMLHFCWEW